VIDVLRKGAAAGTALAALIGGVAFAADPLPDRRGARPPAATAPAPAPAATSSPSAFRQEMAQLLGELEALQVQIRELRGQLEVQANEIQRLKTRQQDVFLDFDKRLREAERRGNASSSRADGNDTALVVTPPTNSATPPGRAGAPTPAEQQQYDAAFALMKQGLYEQAGKNFRAFLARHPQSPLAGHAQYWVGEAAYVTRDFRTALEEFTKVATDYPQSTKLPDALLKIGYSHNELGANDKARATLQDVVARYPNTTVAKAAEQRLSKLSP
jgi:tol-pal system protein YbgF